MNDSRLISSLREIAFGFVWYIILIAIVGELYRLLEENYFFWFVVLMLYRVLIILRIYFDKNYYEEYY